jgi:hypothetical protein
MISRYVYPSLHGINTFFGLVTNSPLSGERSLYARYVIALCKHVEDAFPREYVNTVNQITTVTQR